MMLAGGCIHNVVYAFEISFLNACITIGELQKQIFQDKDPNAKNDECQQYLCMPQGNSASETKTGYMGSDIQKKASARRQYVVIVYLHRP
ncbi:hypothetical protein NDU88_008150 [Pleurodeles waltl]|uniref:Uncharacterized protein n=1 Tax=Pleurodeles waltl TaxID=8319 RepID=A0AAV7VUM6_PLEWA|nr:hypothetical protein NDU88_008150 [Pleurodeles waltl]